MKFVTREQSRNEIVALGLPQIVLDAFDARPLPYGLAIYFCEPYEIFSLGPDGQARYGGGQITPIWMRAGDQKIVAYHHSSERKCFFRFDIVSCDDEQPVGMN